ncbi:MAG: PspA/IM30 family protein [Clostridia bacterium]|nr:PspA/IM30 family protein [Clostridia bacterium]MCL6521040.1 PspA/IM30 family protein [Bacillota bacterium]
MGVLSRFSTVVKAKINKLLDAAEDPRETLDYSYEKQLEQLRQVKRGLAEVVTSKKRIELEAAQLRQAAQKLEDQARQALAAGREDLARTALERKAAITGQLEGLDQQIASLEAEQQKLTDLEVKLRTKVESFRSQKEVIKAQYSAAEAQVRIGEALSGLSEEMSDVGLAVERAREKTEKMRARASAIDELSQSGVLEDPTASDDIDRELRKIAAGSQVESDLERLKKEVGRP